MNSGSPGSSVSKPAGHAVVGGLSVKIGSVIEATSHLTSALKFPHGEGRGGVKMHSRSGTAQGFSDGTLSGITDVQDKIVAVA